MRERLQDLASAVPCVPRAVRPSAVALLTAVGDFIGWSDEALDAALAKLGGATGARDRRAFEPVFSRAVRDRQTAWFQPLKRGRAFPAEVHEVRRAAAPLDDSIRIPAETPDAGPGIRPAFLAETSPTTETPRRTLRRPGAER
jgi:hypothetical protein